MEGFISDIEDWKKHWGGMPEFTQGKIEPFHRIIVSFETKEDMEEFSKLTDQSITTKTKGCWYPKLEKGKHQKRRWVDRENTNG